MTIPPMTAENAPWKIRFRAPAIAFSRVAANAPDRGIVTTNKDGPVQVYAWNVGSGELNRRTDRPEGVVFAEIAPDGKYIYYFDDTQGNEIGHFVRIPFAGGEPEDITPDLPPYSPAFGFVTYTLAFSRDGSRLAFTAGWEDGFHVYVVDLQDGTIGEPREIYHADAILSAPLLAHGGEIVLIASNERYQKPQFSLLAFDAETGAQIGELYEGAASTLTPLFFSPTPGDLRVAALTNQSGKERLLLWNPRTGVRHDPALEDIHGAFNAFDWSPDGRFILFRTFNSAVQQLYIYDVDGDSGYQLNHPLGTNFGPYFGPSGDVHSHFTDGSRPPQLEVLDIETGTIKQTLLSAGEVPPGHVWKSFSFESVNGDTIQGWVVTPPGDGPFPLILDTHGGPQYALAISFLPECQVWVDHGYAWASINYHGSTTFGKDFEESIWGDLGNLEVEDMKHARAWLVQEGIADPDRVILTGWSYGGYLTLQALGKYPDLWAGGMAGIAIADWAMSYEDSAESLRQYQVAIFGGTPDEKPEQYAKSSPITYAENVTAPVLIVQGRNDTRTPARPIEAYEAKMKALGKDIEVVWFDAGHAGAGAMVEQSIENHEKMLAFAQRLMGG